MSGTVYDWVADLPEDASGAAVSLRPYSVNASAFPKPAALIVVEHFAGTSRVCLGGDEWMPTGAVLEPSLRNWFVERNDAETADAYARRSWEQARRFVEGMNEDRFAVFVVAS